MERQIKILLVLLTIFTVEKIHEFSLRDGVAFAQDKKGKIDGLMYLANDQTMAMNAHVVKYLTGNLDRIISIGGNTTYSVPVAKEFKKRLRTRLIDGFMVQYAWTGSDITLQKPKTKYLEFDFDKKKITEKSKNDDNDDPCKPSDVKLKEKIKEKDDKDKIKPNKIPIP